MSDAAAAPAPPSARRRRGRWVPGLIALFALLGIGLVFGAGGDISHPAPRTLAGSDVAAQIATGIQAEEGLSTPPVLRCPATEPVRAGTGFECSVSGVREAGVSVVNVVEIDARGHLRWSLGPQPH